MIIEKSILQCFFKQTTYYNEESKISLTFAYDDKDSTALSINFQSNNPDEVTKYDKMVKSGYSYDLDIELTGSHNSSYTINVLDIREVKIPEKETKKPMKK